MSEMEELDNILTLTDEDGNDVDFELLDVVEYADKQYLILLPVEDDADEVEILEVVSQSEDEDTLDAVEDEVAKVVFDLFKERNPELCD